MNDKKDLYEETSGKADAECGTTTITLARMEKVDFSLPIFVDGGSVMVRANTKLTRLNDLKGKRIAVIAGTLVFTALVYLPSVAILGRRSVAGFVRAAFPSMLMGFSTTSSMATLPTMIDAADHDLRVPRPVSGFVLPLGATINRGGSALYQAIAVLFIARLYGIPFGAAQMLQAGAAVFLASLTVAAVPSGSVLSLFPAFQSTGLPISGISILIGLDRIRSDARVEQ